MRDSLQVCVSPGTEPLSTTVEVLTSTSSSRGAIARGRKISRRRLPNTLVRSPLVPWSIAAVWVGITDAPDSGEIIAIAAEGATPRLHHQPTGRNRRRVVGGPPHGQFAPARPSPEAEARAREVLAIECGSYALEWSPFLPAVAVLRCSAIGGTVESRSRQDQSYS